MPRGTTNFDKRLRSILIQREVLSQKELETAQNESAEKECSLSQAVVDCGLLKEEALITLLAREKRLAPIDVNRVVPDEDLKEILSAMTV